MIQILKDPVHPAHDAIAKLVKDESLTFLMAPGMSAVSFLRPTIDIKSNPEFHARFGRYLEIMKEYAANKTLERGELREMLFRVMTNDAKNEVAKYLGTNAKKVDVTMLLENSLSRLPSHKFDPAHIEYRHKSRGSMRSLLGCC